MTRRPRPPTPAIVTVVGTPSPAALKAAWAILIRAAEGGRP